MILKTNSQVLLRENLKLAKIIKRVKNTDKFLVSYWDEKNKFKYRVISEFDIMDESEYEIVKNRINTINKILKD